MEDQVHKPHRKSKEKKKPQHTGGESPILACPAGFVRKSPRSIN